MPVRILKRKRRGTPSSSTLRDAAEAVLAALGLAGWELSLLLTGDGEMAALNETYRGKRGPTDVLSFPLCEGAPSGDPGLLGDVVICVDTAARQGEAKGHDTGTEVMVLLVHGLCHLAGYDHELGPAQSRRQKRREMRLLEGLGLDPALRL